MSFHLPVLQVWARTCRIGAGQCEGLLWVENGRLVRTPTKTKMVKLKGSECSPILVEVSSGSGHIMSLLPDILQVLL